MQSFIKLYFDWIHFFLPRLQIQQKLQNLINKYDKDVGESSEELHLLRQQLSNEQTDLVVWQIEYDRQDQEYASNVQIKFISLMLDSNCLIQILGHYCRKRTRRNANSGRKIAVVHDE